MNGKITVHLSEHVAERLEAAAQRPGTTKRAILEAALDQFLGAREDPADNVTLLRRLNGMSRQLEQLDRDLRIVSETVALHARYQLTITPPLSHSKQRAACALGLQRFEAFAAQVGRRVHLGTPLMRETMDRVSTTSPDLFARDIQAGAPLGSQLTDHEQGAPAPTAADQDSELPAAVRGDGSNGGFPAGRHSPSR
jgi:hypothetical protein